MLWYLYVLFYKRTENYYVGAAPDWEARLNVHRTKKTLNKLNSEPSKYNISSDGFTYFVYEIQGLEIDESKLEPNQGLLPIVQSISNLVENELAKYLRGEIKKDYIVSGGCFHLNKTEKTAITNKVNQQEIFDIPNKYLHLFKEELLEEFKCDLETVVSKKNRKMIKPLTNKEISLKLLDSGDK